MANPSVIALQLAAASANNIALSQTPGAAGNLTLNGAVGTGKLDVARRIGITSTANDSGVTFTVTGTNRDGAPQSESLVGPNTGTISTVKDYATVASVATSAGTTGAITVGTTSAASSPWVLDNFLAVFWALSVGVSVTGTVTYTVEYTYDDPNAQGAVGSPLQFQWAMEPGSYNPPLIWPLTALTAQTGNKDATFANQPIFAHRLTITAGTGKAVMQSIQAGIGSNT